MYNELFPNLFDQPQSYVAPFVKANKLAVSNLEKLVAFQMSALQSYVDMGLGQCKLAAEITNLQECQEFFSRQLDVAGALRQKVMDDAKALADLSAGFKADFDKLAEENISELSTQATPKGTTRKAA
jgi:phasin family protein